MKKENFYIVYVLFILSITVFLSIQIIKMRKIGVFTNSKGIHEEKIIHELEQFISLEKLREPEYRNSLGFKDYEWKVEKPVNTYRIIALGDSFTEGAYVRINNTWPKQLQTKLNSLNSSLQFEVFNMGGRGYGTSAGTLDELETFKEIGLKYNPNMVILQYYNNDWISPGVKKEIVKTWKRYKTGEYKLSEKIEDEIKKLNVSDVVVSRLISHIVLENYFANVNWEEEWDRWVKEPLLELINITNEKNIKLLVITWDTDWGPKGHKDKLASLLAEHDVPFYDFSQDLPTDFPSDIRLPDGHLTPLGYEIVANKTSRIIIKILE